MTRPDPAAAKKPTPAGYAIGAVFLLFIIGGIFLAIRSGAEDGGSAHVSAASGSSNSLAPDERDGTPYSRPETGELEKAARVAGCLVRENLPEEGRAHLNRGDPVPVYRTNPPTSGDHINPPLQQADGAWRDPAAPVDVVHSLEHGRVAIQYDPELPESAQLELKGLYDTVYSASLLFPNPEMPYIVAATAWRNLIGCEQWRGQQTLDAILAFGATHWGNGPEPAGDFASLSGPGFADVTG